MIETEIYPWHTQLNRNGNRIFMPLSHCTNCPPSITKILPGWPAASANRVTKWWQLLQTAETYQPFRPKLNQVLFGEFRLCCNLSILVMQRAWCWSVSFVSHLTIHTRTTGPKGSLFFRYSKNVNCAAHKRSFTHFAKSSESSFWDSHPSTRILNYVPGA